MHLEFGWHMAIMLFVSGCSYSTEATGVDGPKGKSNNPVANNVANNDVDAGKQLDDDEDNLELDLIDFENAIGSPKETQDSSEEYAQALSNCSLPANLDRYCKDINAQDHAYFKFNLSVAGLLSSMFRDDIVKALAANCNPGSWCLPDTYHQELMQGKSVFYSVNPLCSDEAWECLVIMLDERTDCKEKDLKFLVDSTYMMCNLEDGDDLGLECYARTLEALYVTLLGDVMHGSQSQMTGSKQIDCNGYKAQLTKTFIRAVDACGPYQKSLLNKFGSWDDIIQNIGSTSAVCNISYKAVTSSPPNGDGESEKEEEQQLDKFLQEIEHEIEEDEEMQPGPQDGMKANANGAPQTDNKTMVTFAVVVTIVMAAAFLGLALLSFRRCRARCGYDKLGYSKLGEEEAALLRGELT